MKRLVTEYITPDDPEVVAIASQYSKERIFRMVRDEVEYEPEALDTWRLPRETLKRMKGDCDDKATLLASLLIAKGIDAWVRVAKVPPEYARGPGLHAFVLVREGTHWIYLDPSCDECRWGQVPYEGEDEAVMDFNNYIIIVHDPEAARDLILR